MSSMSAVFKTNPGLVVAFALALGLPLALGLFAVLMRSAGVSLRPVVFLAGLMLPILLVFVVGSLVRARVPADEPAATLSLAVRDGRFADRASLFGAELSDRDIRDAKAVFPEFFAEAEVAELGLVGTGESVLAAQFPDAEAAKRAAAALWKTFGVHNTSGDEESGWRGRRRQNSDYIEMLRTGRHLFFWTGLTKEAAAAHRAASKLPVAASSSAASALVPALQPLGKLFRPVPMKVLGLALMVMLYAGWFFKGAAWAGGAPAPAGVSPLPATELASRFEAINALDVPFRIERGGEPNEYFATWRYADAKWVDLARAHGMRRTFRIKLKLDEAAHLVRATDYAAGYDWSAGGAGAKIEWRAMMGIVFFQTEQQRVFGLQLDERGGFKPELSYSYKFDLNEMKSPLIAATTGAGWDWRPTLWQGPAWLRWLTE
jgi:hypothetical protein